VTEAIARCKGVTERATDGETMMAKATLARRAGLTKTVRA
jgi:hypothetical protein